MKVKKFNETVEQFREVDLNQLWKDYIAYRDKIKETTFSIKNFRYIHSWGLDDMIAEEFRIILEDMLTNEKIEWNRIENPIDGEISYNSLGVVKTIYLHYGTGSGWHSRKILYTADFHYLMPTVSRLSADPPKRYITNDKFNLFKVSDNDRDYTIKIYNSKETDIEETIDMLKNTEKYNL